MWAVHGPRSCPSLDPGLHTSARPYLCGRGRGTLLSGMWEGRGTLLSGMWEGHTAEWDVGGEGHTVE